MKKKLVTFLLEGLTLDQIADLDEAGRVEYYGRRAIFVSERPPKVDRHLIVRDFPGDQVDFLKPWLEQNVVDLLHDEYLLSAPVPQARQKKAVAVWAKVKQRRTEAERALKEEGIVWKRRRDELEKIIEESKDVEVAASEELIRTHGRGPIEINGVTWDPGQNSGRCYFIPRRKKEGSDA